MKIDYKKRVVTVISEVLRCPKEEVDIDVPFAELGIDSFLGLRLVGKLSEILDREIDPLLVLDFNTVRELTSYLEDEDVP